MSIDIRAPTSVAAADLKAMIQHAFRGEPVDPAVARRVEQRAEAIRKRLPVTNIAVDLVREARDDL